MLQAVLTEPQLAKYSLPWHSLVQMAISNRQNMAELKINCADVSECESNPSTQVLAWLGPETIRNVGNSKWHKDQLRTSEGNQK